MTELNDAFEKAVKDVKTLEDKPDNQTLLLLYSYYKQATEGNVSGDKPGFFDFVGLSKYEAWEKLDGLDQEEAKQKYIDKVNQLKG